MAEKNLERQNTIRKRELEQQKASMIAENEEKSKSLKSSKAPQPPGMDVASMDSATMSEASDEQEEQANDEEVEAINSGPDQQNQQNQLHEQEDSSVIESESTQPGSNPEPKSILRKKSKYEQTDINGEPANRRVAVLRNGSVASMALPGEFSKRLKVFKLLARSTATGSATTGTATTGTWTSRATSWIRRHSLRHVNEPSAWTRLVLAGFG